MLIDPHVHSAGISPCSKRTPEKLIAEYIADKMDGFVLTNHCDKTWIGRLGFKSYKEWCKAYNEEYYKTKALGDKYGIKVFFGIEVTALYNISVHYLIYGITPEELLKTPELYALSQEELYNYCKENGFALIQAHPYRNGATPQDPRFLDGVEINCHPNYKYTSDAKKENAFDIEKYMKRNQRRAKIKPDEAFELYKVDMPEERQESVEN